MRIGKEKFVSVLKLILIRTVIVSTNNFTRCDYNYNDGKLVFFFVFDVNPNTRNGDDYEGISFNGI